jgi:hypothetical protein
MMIYKIGLRKTFGDALKETKIGPHNLSSNFRDLHENKSIIKNVTFWKYFFSVYYTFANCYRQSLVFDHTTNIKSHINAKKEKFKPSKVRRALKLEVRILLEFLL